MENETKTNVGSTFFEFITVTVRFRWFLFWFVLVVSVAATTYALLSPKWYKAAASVLPAEKNDLLSTLSGISSLTKGFSAGKGLAALAGTNSESDKYVAILKSGTITDDIIKKFDLRKEYEKDNDFYEKVVKEWQSNCEFDIQNEGTLTIGVYDKDPKKAAEIANYLIDKLNEVNTNLGVQNAKANRIFVEKRYLQSKNDIDSLESMMKMFQEKYGVIAVPEQLEATVKSMSTIYVDFYQKELQFNVLKQTYGADHPMTKKAKIELDEMKKKINDLNAGKDDSQKDVKLLIPFKQAPKLSNEYLKIYQNLKIQYTILEFIQPLYEQAKIEEVRNTPSVLVLDRAGAPERKAKPKASLYALTAMVTSLVVGYLIVFFIVLMQKSKMVSPEKYNFIVENLKSDLRKIGLFRRKRI
jgi:tyrosine-protein kinase Etk/Wzc